MSVPPPLAFIDTETASLGRDRLAWDVAIIRRGGNDGLDGEFECIIDVPVHDADPAALRIGRYYERHPGARGEEATPEALAARQIERRTRGAVLIGSNPDFDVHTLEAMLRRHGYLLNPHYRHPDVVTLAVGWLATSDLPEHLELVRTLPWKSEQISEAVGVLVDRESRHTALGDARWAMALWDAVMG